jgi:hypothetical protein
MVTAIKGNRKIVFILETKMVMCNKKLFYFDHLDKLHLSINISDYEHSNLDSEYIHKQLISPKISRKPARHRAQTCANNF